MQASTHVVWGIALHDEETAKLVRRVLTVATVMGLLVIVSGVVRIVVVAAADPMGVTGPIFGILLGLLVPACGYFGALRRDRSLLNWFACCNGCGVVMFVLSAIGMLITRANLDSAHEDCMHHRDSGSSDCDLYLRRNYTRFMILMFSLGIVPFVLNVLGCIWGRRLATTGVFVSGYAVGYAPGTYPTAPQPAVVYVHAASYGTTHQQPYVQQPNAQQPYPQQPYAQQSYAPQAPTQPSQFTKVMPEGDPPRQ